LYEVLRLFTYSHLIINQLNA